MSIPFSNLVPWLMRGIFHSHRNLWVREQHAIKEWNARGGDRPYCPCPRGNGGERFCFDLQQHFGKVQIWEIWQDFFLQWQNYSQAVLCLGINPHFREQNCERHKIYGAWEKRIHINEQTSWLLFFVAFGQPFSLWLEIDDGRKYMKDYCTKWLMDWRTTGGVVTTLEKSWPLHRNVGGGQKLWLLIGLRCQISFIWKQW